MLRTCTRFWLNLLLALLLATGPLPVLAGDEDPSDPCCMTSHGPAMTGHGDCCNPAGQGGCAMDHGCPDGHCSVAAFLPVAATVTSSRQRSLFAAATAESYPDDTPSPPIPPPIL